jgi:hypothetical protein
MARQKYQLRRERYAKFAEIMHKLNGQLLDRFESENGPKCAVEQWIVNGHGWMVHIVDDGIFVHPPEAKSDGSWEQLEAQIKNYVR